MGGRGASSASGWKKQLKTLAKNGQMPGAIMGSKEQRKLVFEEIDKLYSVSIPKDATIVDQGDGVWVNYKGTVSRLSYPSGQNATQAEKSGVLKFLLWNKK